MLSNSATLGPPASISAGVRQSFESTRCTSDGGWVSGLYPSKKRAYGGREGLVGCCWSGSRDAPPPATSLSRSTASPPATLPRLEAPNPRRLGRLDAPPT